MFLKDFCAKKEFEKYLTALDRMVYSNEFYIVNSLLHLANSLQCDFEDEYKMLVMKYLLQLADRANSYRNNVGDTLYKDKILNNVYTSVMKLKSALYASGQNNEKLTLCISKFIAIIGVGRPFVNVGIGCDEIAPFDRLSKQEHYLENQKIKLKYHDWNIRACDYEGNFIKIHRSDSIKYGFRLRSKIRELLDTTDKNKKNYLFSLFKLEYVLIDQ